MEEIKFDKRNYRLHNDENKRVIKKSLKELGAGRSIVIDNEGEIIAGNGVYEQAKKLGIKTKIVETDGSEFVVVKRTDIHTEDEKRKKLALADNAASDTSEWADELCCCGIEGLGWKTNTGNLVHMLFDKQNVRFSKAQKTENITQLMKNIKQQTLAARYGDVSTFEKLMMDSFRTKAELLPLIGE